ncbi:SCO2584 family spore wall biosynthesis protein [Streptomyces sp. NBC_01304]|uniref:SCO2584 family spore wall biosynthesis protein n=1 Tax=Streptomyces sp. NBC_01304 TaxID=2903818 RepID=UPI002E10F361|nr:hypothetical protein OG430_31690 [Streptomyces sp. NBC_01304]
MPDDVGGSPFPDGWEPDDDHHGGADEEFAAVVFDEDFVRAATVHEPTAVERLLAAAQARAEADAAARHAPVHGAGGDDDPDEFYDGYDGYDGYGSGVGRGGRHGRDAFGRDPHLDHEGIDFDLVEDGHSRRGQGRWHRPVAWILALLMGIGMVALAFTAVYRGASSGSEDQIPPPATADVGGDPSASPDYSHSPVPAAPRLP